MRVKRGVKGRRHKKRALKQAKGFVGGRSRLIRTAYNAVERGLRYAYRDRRVKKRDFRNLWITRIGIASSESDVSYSKFMGALKKKNITLNRKMLAEISVSDPKGFDQLVSFAAK